MTNNIRCLYNTNISEFLSKDKETILGILHSNYHGEALTTTSEAWIGEIEILQKVINDLNIDDGQIIFEYDIPRLGKRIDVVLLIRGIIFCLEFKVGQKDILLNDMDQALDYALDLKNFHKYSEDKIIVPILVSTKYNDSSKSSYLIET